MDIERSHIISAFIVCGIIFALRDDPSPVVSAQETPVIVEESAPVGQVSQGKYEYLEVTEGCTHGTAELCVWAYAGPGTQYEELYQLEKGMLLKVKGEKEMNGVTWYHVYFDEWLRYPERTDKDWYVPAAAGRIVKADGVENVTSKSTTTKRIIVDLSDQMLYAYDGDKEFMRTKVSTGERNTPTPTGTFTIYKKTPTRYMQGPLPGVTSVPFDLPGVPWNMYFTQGGAVIHGTYWHNDYGNVESSGCVNLPPELANILYTWAPVGTTVLVQK
jgi:hypothetical protein